MSPNSGLRTVSSSTASMRSLELPLFPLLKRPMYWLGSAAERLLVPETTNARPQPLTPVYWDPIANTKVDEKDSILPPPPPPPRGDLNWSGAGKKACPIVCLTASVTRSRPSELTYAAPSRRTFAPRNPLKMKVSSAEDATRRKRKSRILVAMSRSSCVLVGCRL
ncbi:L-type lectin-domain containing receptor kinase IV.1-like [Iris pallida]|uniref:L-type lectin-domain containing receptor kinase IV.1-like n=1 Tax=Iris pallida TaxID=29817 RepID=A0AAX6GIT3_IRIPA|nr:L-type lectin-domain containing receptor kinase IV.1-like [Iris pallida]